MKFIFKQNSFAQGLLAQVGHWTMEVEFSLGFAVGQTRKLQIVLERQVVFLPHFTVARAKGLRGSKG